MIRNLEYLLFGLMGIYSALIYFLCGTTETVKKNLTQQLRKNRRPLALQLNPAFTHAVGRHFFEVWSLLLVQASTKICDDCGGSGVCPECKGEGFVLKKLSEESAERARLMAKNAANRYTAG